MYRGIKIAATVTAAALISITLTTGGVMAADVSQSNSMDNFELVLPSPNFTDVESGVWYEGNVKTAYTYSLMVGSSATTFSPDKELTLQEAVILAARLRCIYEWGSNSVQYPDVTPVKNADDWAAKEINYAIKTGIIKSTDFTDYRSNATRAQMAYIFAHALPTSTGVYTAVNVVDDNAIPDVKTSDKYGSEIYTLYRAGVLTGGDGNKCNPNNSITRAETAAIVSRLPFPAQHQSVTLLNPNQVRYAKLADGVTNAPWQSRTVYVGTANNSTGQPRRTTASGAAVNQINTRYGYHNYWCANQAEYDAVVSFVQNSYNATVKKGTTSWANLFGMNLDSWKVVDDIIAGKEYRADLWQTYVNSYFPAVAANIKDAKTQAQTIRLYAQYRALYTGTSKAAGETGGITAYDGLYLAKGSCNSNTQIQMLCADMLGIDSCSYVSADHQSGILRINGVYFDAEGEGSFTSLKDATFWADFGQMTEWTSASAPTK